MIIVTGSLAWDYIMEFPGKFGEHILPQHIHNLNISFIVQKFAKRRGGTAGNVSYTLGLLKTPHILFSSAGKDFEEYAEEFKKHGIDSSHVLMQKNEYTATGFAMTDKSNNQIWGFYYGASLENTKLHVKKIATNKDLVLVGPQGAKGSMHFINECIDLGINYMFDPGFILTDISDQDLERGLSHCQYIVGNEYEFSLMKKRITKWKEVVKNTIQIITRGEKGATIIDRNTTHDIQPVSVAKVSSTTGAGDSWRGGFLAGLQRQYDLTVCGQMGAVASSFTVEEYGTQEHVYTKKQFQKRYRQTYGSLVEL